MVAATLVGPKRKLRTIEEKRALRAFNVHEALRRRAEQRRRQAFASALALAAGLGLGAAIASASGLA